jgi:hypothetical protein
MGKLAQHTSTICKGHQQLSQLLEHPSVTEHGQHLERERVGKIVYSTQVQGSEESLR